MPSAPPPLARAEMAIAAHAAYLNTALMSPLPRAAAVAMAVDAERAGARASGAYDERQAEAEAVRAAAAFVLGVAADDLSFTRGTTDGLATVAAGLDWRPGDRVVVVAGDHTNTTLCWRAQAHRGVVVDVAASPAVDDVARILEGGRVRVVALSWVQAHDGWRADVAALARLAHEHGALLCVDAIQGAGVLPAALAAWGADATAAGAQKWLMGPHGLGLLHVDGALRERLHPSALGGGSVQADGALVPSGRRFEGGALNHSGIAGLGAALGLLRGAGIDAVGAWVDRLGDRIADGLAALGAEITSDRSPERRSALVAARLPGWAATDAVAALDAAGVVVAARDGAVRVSPHGWNDDADVDALLAAVATLV